MERLRPLLVRLRHRLRLRARIRRLGRTGGHGTSPRVRRSSVTDHTEYTALCARAATDDAVFAGFKRTPVYREVLEHVTYEQGRAYLERIAAQTPELVGSLGRFRPNDRFGSPVTGDYGEHGTFSPTTLRYVKVLSDLKLFFGDLDGLRIVEIGAGYGGQCFVVETAARPAAYTLVDLPQPLALQRRYLTALGIEDVMFVAPYELDSRREYDLVISNYAFSECRREVQDAYLAAVLQRAARGYVTCNWISPPEFRSHSRDELLTAVTGSRFVREEPLTAPANAILVWGASEGGVELYEHLVAAGAHG